MPLIHRNQAALGLVGIWKGDLQCKCMFLKITSVEATHVATNECIVLRDRLEAEKKVEGQKCNRCSWN